MTMRCPNCGAEYVDGSDICSDCQITLVKKEAEQDEKEDFIQTGVDVEKLTSVSNHMEAELLQGILKNLGIPSYAQDQEGGGYMKVYMGYSVFGEDIYVRSSDLMAANECLKEWEHLRESEPDDSMFPDDASEGEEEEQDTAGGSPMMLMNRREAAIIMLIALAILGLLGLFPHIS